MYYKLTVFNPDNDLYCYDYFVADNDDNEWETIGRYAKFIEMCGCPVIAIQVCTNDEVSMVIEKTFAIRDGFREYGIAGEQYYTGENWFPAPAGV